MALDLTMFWSLATEDDEFTGRMLAAVNGMLAAITPNDYVDRRQRQANDSAKAFELHKDRPEDRKRNDGIATMPRAGSPWQQIQGAFGRSRDPIARVRSRIDSGSTAEACSYRIASEKCSH